MGDFPGGSILKSIAVMRERANRLLPDICTIQKATITAIDEYGTPVTTPVFVEYEGSSNIPCRFDVSRSFRPEQGEFQEIAVSEFTLYIPVGIDIYLGYVVRTTDNNGNERVFEPRKFSSLSSWDMYQEITVEEMQDTSV